MAVGYFVAILWPLPGFFIGVALLFRRRNHGIAVIAISISIGVWSLVDASRDADETSLPPGTTRKAKALTRCIVNGPPAQSFEQRMRVCERRLNWQGP